MDVKSFPFSLFLPSPSPSLGWRMDGKSYPFFFWTRMDGWMDEWMDGEKGSILVNEHVGKALGTALVI